MTKKISFTRAKGMGKSKRRRLGIKARTALRNYLQRNYFAAALLGYWDSRTWGK